jgi:mycothiol synthase
VAVHGPDDLNVRRVGFRAGTDSELTALHAVEIPVAAERGSSRMPEPVQSYIAFARKLPVQFDDHAWLAEASDGTPVGAGFCWSNSAGDLRVMECDVLVRRDRRRQHVGSRLLAAIVAETAAESRSLLTWSTFDDVPAGEAFSRHIGARVARVNRTSELALADADWPMIAGWTRAARERGRGYRLDLVDGVYPDQLRADAVVFHHIMQTAPRENLEAGDVIIDSEFVAQLDRALTDAGRTRWTVFVRDPGGACVGGTEVIFEPGDPGTATQQSTGIDPAHRGLGLARWAKAAMLQWIRDERPAVVRIRTGNAFSNVPMLSINEALGFRSVGTRTEWQADVAALAARQRR